MPHDLPEGWAESLADDEVGFLYEEARQQLRETIQFGALQEAKTYALLSVSLILVSAGSIFGDLRIGHTLIGIVSAVALLLSVVALLLALLLLRPRNWEEGADIAYFARWALSGYVGARNMKGVILEEVLAPGERANSGIVKERDRVLLGLWLVVLIEAYCVVFVQIFAVAS